MQKEETDLRDRTTAFALRIVHGFDPSTRKNCGFDASGVMSMSILGLHAGLAI